MCRNNSARRLKRCTLPSSAQNLPQDLRDYAGIDKELVTIGILDKIEIWSRAEWEKTEDGPQLAPEDFAQKMAEYGI